jgi:hypothetical protein
VSLSHYGGDGRKASHCFFRVNEDDISNHGVFKDELEEDRNFDGLQGHKVGGTFGGQIFSPVDTPALPVTMQQHKFDYETPSTTIKNKSVPISTVTVQFF